MLILILCVVRVLFHSILISRYTKTAVIHDAAVPDMQKNAHASLCSMTVHLYKCFLVFCLPDHGSI